jgi:hypothetical protein
MNTNPIYKEYSSHEQCECYKIDLPYPKFLKHTVILCPVTKGFECAKIIAIGVVINNLMEAFNNNPLKEEENNG